MKTLTKILTVVALVVLCVSLFTLTAYAATVTDYVKASPASCTKQGNIEYWKDDEGNYYDSNPVSGASATGAVGKEVDDTSGQLGGFSDTQTGPLDHELKKHPAKAKDCGNGIPGNIEYYQCQVCGKCFDDDQASTEYTPNDYIIPATHSASPSGGYPPTCDQPGLKDWDKCSDCGKLIDGNGNPTTWDKLVIPATGDHVFSTWTVTKAPTNVSPGIQVSVCDNCGVATKEETIPALGIDDGEDIYYVIATRDTWIPGEEPLTFSSPLIKKLNTLGQPVNANYVGVRIGTDSLYENSYDTYDFWSWDQYVMLGEKTMNSLEPGIYRLWIYDRLHPEVYTDSCTFWILDVPTLEPYSTDKHVVNSSKSLRFVASEEIDPNTVRVGSRLLYDSSDYFVSNDRKNITLSADFLNNRQTGTYTISAKTKDGQTVKTNFYILTTAQASSSPRTGDESQIGLWAAFLLLSGAAVVVLVPKLRKTGVK
ncbi:MAG: sortase B protein-sorting domain-containing protein [Oscillospiraceae bacterium]|nr:sortase B protein-sorting domain-containing protein [Oscillospiraceae bacterium]